MALHRSAYLHRPALAVISCVLSGREGTLSFSLFEVFAKRLLVSEKLIEASTLLRRKAVEFLHVELVCNREVTVVERLFFPFGIKRSFWRWEPSCIALQCVFKGQVNLKAALHSSREFETVERSYLDRCFYPCRAVTLFAVRYLTEVLIDAPHVFWRSRKSRDGCAPAASGIGTDALCFLGIFRALQAQSVPPRCGGPGMRPSGLPHPRAATETGGACVS
jgi:hypothetical protein